MQDVCCVVGYQYSSMVDCLPGYGHTPAGGGIDLSSCRLYVCVTCVVLCACTLCESS